MFINFDGQIINTEFITCIIEDWSQIAYGEYEKVGSRIFLVGDKEFIRVKDMLPNDILKMIKEKEDNNDA